MNLIYVESFKCTICYSAAKYEGEIADWYLYGCRVASAVSVIPKQGYTGLRQAALALLL